MTNVDALDNPASHAQWKGLELICQPLHELLVVHHGEGYMFWDMEIFHNHLRKMAAAKWLRKAGGASRVHRAARMLCPYLNYEWIPNAAMLAAVSGQHGILLPGVARGKKQGTTVMASIPWILVYLLATNTMQVVEKNQFWIREKAFHLLSSLVSLACCSSCKTLDDQVSMSSYFGKATVDMKGIVRGDDAWEAQIDTLTPRCREILTSLGSGGARQGPGLGTLGSGCGAAAMMWHWALLTWRTHGTGRNKEIHKVGQSILGELLAFTANQLAKWAAQQEEAPTSVLVSLQRKGK